MNENGLRSMSIFYSQATDVTSRHTTLRSEGDIVTRHGTSLHVASRWRTSLYVTKRHFTLRYVDKRHVTSCTSRQNAD